MLDYILSFPLSFSRPSSFYFYFSFSLVCCWTFRYHPTFANSRISQLRSDKKNEKKWYGTKKFSSIFLWSLKTTRYRLRQNYGMIFRASHIGRIDEKNNVNVAFYCANEISTSYETAWKSHFLNFLPPGYVRPLTKINFVSPRPQWNQNRLRG